MPQGAIANLLIFATTQLASEAFLLREEDAAISQLSSDDIRDRLVEGNGHVSKFIPAQATEFVSEYEVIAQYRNDPLKAQGSGFSGTLFKNRDTGELTLSFRSTEFLDDAARDTKATNDLEIKDLGWAFGQIAEMESWYAELRSDPALLGNARFNVTGYSLGGHLATAFDILRRDEYAANPEANPIIATYTFNGAGTGQLLNHRSLTDLIADFNRIRQNYETSPEWASFSKGDQDVLLALAQSRVNAIASERSRIAGLTGVAGEIFQTTGPSGDPINLAYQVAALLVAQDTVGALRSNVPLIANPVFVGSSLKLAPDLIPGITEIVGMEKQGLASSFVSNSGIHYGSRVEAPIEGQPVVRGNYLLSADKAVAASLGINLLVDNPKENDFGDTHSLILIIDSLSVMAAFEALDPTFTLETGKSLFSATSSASAASGVFGSQGSAEGDVLERMVDALYKIVVHPSGPNASLDYFTPLDGNTWHLSILREPFYRKLTEINGALDDYYEGGGQPFRVRLFSDLTESERDDLRQGSDAAATAYRFALRELNPFVVIGSSDFYVANNADGSLGLYDDETGLGMTEAYLSAREEMLRWKNQYFDSDGQIVLRTRQSWTQQFVDKTFKDTENEDLTLSVLGQKKSIVKTIFGGDADDELVGADVSKGDKLFGGGGGDTLLGKAGADYLEGNSGADILDGGADNDYLLGGSGADTMIGGGGNDVLDGGEGSDSYLIGSADGVDTIVDSDGVGTIRVLADADTWFSLTGGKRRDDNLWQSEDSSISYSLEANTDGGQTLTVTSKGGRILVEDFQNGELSIVLADSQEQVAQAPPEDGREIRGDLAPKVFTFQPIPSQLPPGITAMVPIPETPTPFDFYLVDDLGLGNFVRDPARPIANENEFPFLHNLFNRQLWGSDAGDHMVAWNFGNFMAGFGGDDYIEGGLGRDAAGGGDGDDYLEGGGFGDTPLEVWLSATSIFSDGTIVGGVDDVLDGGDGDDVIFGGKATDLEKLLDPQTPEAGHKGDFLTGNDGDDELYGSTGDDLLVGGHGKDSLVGGPGDDVLDGDDDFAPSHIVSFVDGTWKVERGPSPFEVKFFPVSTGPMAGNLWPYYKEGGGDDDLSGGSGDDILIGMLGDDLLSGDGGEDTLSGWEGADRLLGGEGDDVMAGDFGGYEQVDGRLMEGANYAPPGFLDSRHGHSGPVELMGNDFLDGEDGDDLLYGEGGEDILIGGKGDDELWGDAAWLPGELQAGDYLAGGAGDDTLNGGGGGDVLKGGSGADILDGGEGSDTYDFAKGDGKDSILDAGEEGFDTVDVGYERDEAIVRRRLDGAVLISGADGDEITIAALSDEQGPGIESIRFSDGTTLTSADFIALPVDESDIGGEDWATYSDDGEIIDASELPATGAFVMVDAGGGDDIVHGVPNGLISGGSGNDILLNGHSLLGGEGNDLLSGGVVLLGGPGDDSLVDGATLDGGPGNDTLEGGSGANRYFVNPRDFGAELVIDIDGSSDAFLDAYYRSLGIEDWESRRGLTETEFRFDPGDNPTTFHSFEEVQAFFDNPGLTVEEAINRGVEILEPLPEVQIAANDYAALETYYESGVIELDELEFGKGISLSSLTFTIGSVQADFNPHIFDDQNHSTLELSWEGGGLVRVVMPNGADPVGSGIEQISFSDGSLYSMAEMIAMAPPAPEPSLDLVGTTGADVLEGRETDEQLHGLAGDDRLSGNGGNDALQGQEGNDLLVGGTGDDILDGGEGDDVYFFHLGDGVDRIVDSSGRDEIVFDDAITPDMVSLALGSLLVRVGAGADAIHIDGFDPSDVFGSEVIEIFEFAGQSFTYEQMVGRGFDLVGTESSDTMVGTNVDDRINGKGGDDVLQGGEGDDTYLIEMGGGSDFISDASGNDTVQFGPGIDIADVVGVRDADTLTLEYGDEHLTIRWQPSQGFDISTFRFADGASTTAARFLGPSGLLGTPGDDELEGGAANDTIRGLGGDDELFGDEGHDVLEGGSGDDDLSGSDGNDTLDGGSGKDDLEGEGGNDTYLFGRGYGHDFIYDDDETPGNLDEIRFGAGIAHANITVTADLRGSLHFILDGGPDRLTIGDWFTRDSQKIERVRFADGTQWSIAQVESRIVPAIPSPFDDGLNGTKGNDFIAGLGGDDEIFGAEGNDALIGGDGDDFLHDEDGSNYVSGGGGADYLEVMGPAFLAGGPGDDTLDFHEGGKIFAMNRGDGRDTTFFPPFEEITNFTLSLGGGIATSDLFLERTGQDLLLHIGANDEFRVEGWYQGDGPPSASGLLQIIGGEVRTFDFLAVADAFDTAREGNSTVGAWSAHDALEANLLEVASDHAIGGDIAYGYARDGNTDGLSSMAIESVPNDPAFGFSAQALTIFEEPVNRAPVLVSPIADATLFEDAPGNIAIPTSAFLDPDGDELTFAATLDSEAPLPEWLLFDPRTLVFSGLPANTNVGAMRVRITASDVSGLSGAAEFSIFVANVNDGPINTAGIGDRVLQEDTAFTYAVPSSTFEDLDTGDVLKLGAELAGGLPLPGWLTFDKETERFAGTPTNEDVGTWSIVVTARDLAGAQATADFHVTVENVNDSPGIGSPIGKRIAMEDAAFSFSLPEDSFADPDSGDSLTYTASLANGAGLPDWLTFDGESATFTGLPGNDDVGTVAIRVGVTDSSGASVSGEFELQIDNENDAPEAVEILRDQTIQAGNELEFVIPGGAFRDVDAEDSLTYSATLVDGTALPDWLGFDESDSTFSGTPSADDEGTAFITLTATDGQGARASATFGITVIKPVGVFLEGTRGDDVLIGTDFDDVLLGNRGQDVLHGAGANDSLDGGRGNDFLFGDNGQDMLLGKGGRDTLHGGDGADTLVGGARADALSGEGGNDGVYGDKGDDCLDGGSGNDALDGGQDRDTLIGGSGDDALTGGKGADRLAGGDGNDIYLHEVNGGNDTIKETGGTDSIVFGNGITADMVRVKRKQDDLLLDLKGDGGSIAIDDWFKSDSSKIESVHFSDGTAWSLDNILGPQKSRQSAMPQNRVEEMHVMTPDDAKSSWNRIKRYLHAMDGDVDREARRGAASIATGALDTGSIVSTSFGYPGSIGVSRGMESMKTRQGLEEGLQHLRG